MYTIHRFKKNKNDSLSRFVNVHQTNIVLLSSSNNFIAYHLAMPLIDAYELKKSEFVHSVVTF